MLVRSHLSCNGHNLPQIQEELTKRKIVICQPIVVGVKIEYCTDSVVCSIDAAIVEIYSRERPLMTSIQTCMDG